ncbi:hypothetical protein HanPI659440_Chr01g0029701 [Helianthus annuus]|nr:hypothetical protein HanPI659440_Chr01g0029701 [Helianthus annuus]
MSERVKRIKKERKTVVRMRGKWNLHPFCSICACSKVIYMIKIISKVWFPTRIVTGRNTPK